MTVFWLLAGLTLAVDRAAKWVTQSAMSYGERIVAISGVLELRYAHPY